MKQEMKKVRDITMEDVEDLLAIQGTKFDVLVATAARAKDILDAALPKRRESPSAEKKSRNSANLGRRGEQHPPPPPLPERFERAIRELAQGKTVTAAKLVIQKRLYETDLKPNNNRLSIPTSQIASKDFLTEEEEEYLRAYDERGRGRGRGRNKKYMVVKMVEPSTAVATVKFTWWDMSNTSSTYVINGTWQEIVKRNDLDLNTEVQLWSFRIDQDLCFALVRLPRKPYPT